MLASMAAFAQKQGDPKDPPPKEGKPPKVVVPKGEKPPPKGEKPPDDGRRRPQGELFGLVQEKEED